MITDAQDTPAFPVPLAGAQSTLMWVREDDLEPAAAEQLRNISRLPWLHGLRVMPDVHNGKGATVGSVIALRDAVSPAVVGVDIGCGMAAVPTSLTADDLAAQTAGIECRKDSGVVDEIPAAYKDIDAVIDAQKDLVQVVAKLRQVVCVKG